MSDQLTDSASTKPRTEGDAASPPRRRIGRRAFLAGAAGLCAVAGASAAGYWFTRERVSIGILGAGRRGSALANKLRASRFLPVYGDVVAVCDVHRGKAERLAATEAPGATVYDDYRAVLDRDDIDAIIVATPDHWHAKMGIDAMRAGKALYCEKPLSLTIREGQEMVSVARETGALVQVGTQQRSDWGFRTACELVRNGRLGRIRKVTITLQEKGLVGGPFQPEPVPPELNWTAWLGPAPRTDYCSQRYDHWRYWWEYSGGEMTNWGVHHLDIAQWALGLEHSGPLIVEGRADMPRIENGYSTPRHFEAHLHYAGGVEIEIKTSETEENGVLFEGDRDRIFVNREKYTGEAFEVLKVEPLPPGAIRLHDNPPSHGHIVLQHLQNFLHCVLTDDLPVSDIASAHRASSACHLANIALRLGRELHWDPSLERFENDPQAEMFLSNSAPRSI